MRTPKFFDKLSRSAAGIITSFIIFFLRENCHDEQHRAVSEIQGIIGYCTIFLPWTNPYHDYKLFFV